MHRLPEVIILNLGDSVRAFANHAKIQDRNYGFTSDVVDSIVNCLQKRYEAIASVQDYASEVGYRTGSQGETWVSLEEQVTWLAWKIMAEIERLGLYGDDGVLMYEPREMDEHTLPDEVVLTRRGDDPAKTVGDLSD